MKILILGAGNLLLSDEGFGVHFIRYLENNYQFPDNIELCDAGTSGIMQGSFVKIIVKKQTLFGLTSERH